MLHRSLWVCVYSVPSVTTIRLIAGRRMNIFRLPPFFSQVGRKRAADPRENIIYNRNSGEINHPVHKTNDPQISRG